MYVIVVGHFFLTAENSHSQQLPLLLPGRLHEEEEEEEEDLVKQDILQRSSLLFPWPCLSPRHTVDRLNEDTIPGNEE